MQISQQLLNEHSVVGAIRKLLRHPIPAGLRDDRYGPAGIYYFDVR